MLGRALGEGGFDPARDIEAITANRWSHGYAYEYMRPWDAFWPDGPLPIETARKSWGRIAIANSDSGAYAYAHSAIDQAARAVKDLLGDKAKIARLCRLPGPAAGPDRAEVGCRAGGGGGGIREALFADGQERAGHRRVQGHRQRDLPRAGGCRGGHRGGGPRSQGPARGQGRGRGAGPALPRHRGRSRHGRGAARRRAHGARGLGRHRHPRQQRRHHGGREHPRHQARELGPADGASTCARPSCWRRRWRPG